MKLVGLIGLILMTTSANATPVRYIFVQGGYPEGATVDGMFYGDDLDRNGILTEDELEEFIMSWSGNSAIAPHTINHWHAPAALHYTLTDNQVGPFPKPGSTDSARLAFPCCPPDSREYVTWIMISNNSDPDGRRLYGLVQYAAPLADIIKQTSYERAVITLVHVPAVFWLFGSGVIGLLGARRREHLNRV